MAFYNSPGAIGLMALAVVLLIAWALSGRSGSSGSSNRSSRSGSDDSTSTTSTDSTGNPAGPRSASTGDATGGSAEGGSATLTGDDIEVSLSDELEATLSTIAENTANANVSNDQEMAVENDLDAIAAVVSGMQDILVELEQGDVDIDITQLEQRLTMIEQRLMQVAETTNGVELDIDNSQDLEATLENVLSNSLVQELEDIRVAIENSNEQSMNIQQMMQVVMMMEQMVDQSGSPASPEVLQVLQNIQQTLNQIEVEVSQTNNLLQSIEQYQQQIVNISQGNDSEAVRQFEMLLQQFQQVINQMSVQNTNEINFGDIDIDIDGGGSVPGDTLIQIIEMLRQDDVSIQVLVQKLEMHQQVTNQLLIQILQEIRTGDDGGETVEVQQLLSVLGQRDLEHLSEAEQKELEQVTQEAKRVIREEKKEMRVLNTVAGRYSRMIPTIVKLHEGLEEVVEQGEHRTNDDEYLRTQSIQGGAWSAIQYADDGNTGYDPNGAGLHHVHEDAVAIRDDLEEFMDIEKAEGEDLREEIGILKDEVKRFKGAFQVYKALETAFQDYDGSRQEFLVSVTDQVVSRGIYNDRDMVVNELESIWEMGPHLEQHLRECEALLRNEYEVGLEIIEHVEDLYGDIEKLNDIWNEDYVEAMERNIEEVVMKFQDELREGTTGPRETLVERAMEIVKVNNMAESELQQIVQRKKREEKAMQEVEQELESLNF